MPLHINAPADEGRMPYRSILSTMACLRSQRQIVLRDWSTLSLSLLRNDITQGLHALERLCQGLLVIEQLVELVRLAAVNVHERQLAVAHDLRSRTVREVLPLIAAARHDL